MKKTPLRRASKKRAKQLRAYSALKAEFLKKYRFCECTCGNHAICITRSQDVHHLRGRSGAMLLDERFWLAICRPCHRWIEENKRAARNLGLILYK